MKNLTTFAIAEALGAKLIGDGTIRVSRLAHPTEARGEADLALAFDSKLLPLLAQGGARAAVVSADAEVDPGVMDALILVDRGRFAMAKLTALFDEPVAVQPGIHSTAVIEDGAQLGENVSIGAYSYVCAGAAIGDNSVIHPQVYIGPDVVLGRDALVYSGTRIGARVMIGDRAIIHFNTSIGADGFSFVTPQMGSVEAAKATGAVGEARNSELVRIASLGSVVIGDDVEIGANSSIDRGTITATRIGSGTKIDNQVQIGHNVVIGDNCMICGRVGIAGSALIGDRVVIGGASGVADHVKIGDDAIIMGMSGVASNIQPKGLVVGIPAKPRQLAAEHLFALNSVKHLVKKIEKLTARLDALEIDVES